MREVDGNLEFGPRPKAFQRFEGIEPSGTCHILPLIPLIAAGVSAAGSAASAGITAASGAGKVTGKNVDFDRNSLQLGGYSPEQREADNRAWRARQAVASMYPGSPGYDAAMKELVESGKAAQNVPTWTQKQQGSSQEFYDKAGELNTLKSAQAAQAAAASQGRQGATMDLGAYNKDRALGLQSRQGLVGAGSLYQQAALGKGPSAAQAQMQTGLDASMRQQASMAASARGSSLARNAAMRQAAVNQAGLSQGVVNQAAQLRAQEQQAGMAGYLNSQQALTGVDAQRAAMAGQIAGQQAQFADAQLARNDVREQFYRQQEMARDAAVTNAFQSNLSNQSTLAGADLAAKQGVIDYDFRNANLAAGAALNNAAIDRQNLGIGLKAGSEGLGFGMQLLGANQPQQAAGIGGR